MEPITAQYEIKSLFAEGEKGIITGFKNAAHKSRSNPILKTALEYEPICSIASEFISFKEQLNKHLVTHCQSILPVLERIKKKAKRQIIKDGQVNDEYLKLFGFKDADLVEEITLRNLMIDYLEKAIQEHPFFYVKMEKESLNGYKVDFTLAKDLEDELDRLTTKLIEPGDDNSIRTQKNNRCKQLSKEIQKELNIRNREKSHIENLCYFLLNDGIEANKSESRFHKKLTNLSKTNLMNLIRFYVKVYNEHFRQELNNQEKEKTKMCYKRRQSFSKPEKKFYIQALKNDGLDKNEIAKELDCSLRTVERYWNN